MKRRQFISKSLPLALGLSGLSRVAFSRSAGMVYVLRGAQCYVDGRLQERDIGIDSTGRLAVSEPGTMEGEEIIPLHEKIVSPGFIDVLTDNTANPERTYATVERFKVTDGVTTALQMHGGSAKIADYYRIFGAKSHYVNYGVSTAVMRVRYGSNNLAERKRRVEQCLDEGALGVSHSIEYQPTPYAEVAGYGRLAKKYDRPLFLHLRFSSRENELAGVDEAVSLARDTGARVHIAHLHSTGGTFHMEQALERIRNANARGLRITCCVYPYSYWATYLHSTRFDEGWRERYGLSFNDLRLVGTGERLTAETFVKYRTQHRLVAVPEGTMPLDKTVDLALREPFCLIGSDGGIEYASQANSHPRGAGCFATAVRHALDIGMTMESILARMTTGPRDLMRPALNDRGAVVTGAWADLVAFDPKTIKGTATVSNPNQYSAGIEAVWVNGKVAYRNGALQERVGKPIRY